jgi:hypothetical protein
VTAFSSWRRMLYGVSENTARNLILFGISLITLGSARPRVWIHYFVTRNWLALLFVTFSLCGSSVASILDLLPTQLRIQEGAFSEDESANLFFCCGKKYCKYKKGLDSAEVKNVGAVPPLPLTSSCRVVSHLMGFHGTRSELRSTRGHPKVVFVITISNVVTG